MPIIRFIIIYLRHTQYDLNLKDNKKRAERVNRLFRIIGKENIEDVDEDDITYLKQQLIERHRQPSYINVYLQILRSMFKYAKEKKLETLDPDSIKCLHTPKKQIDFLSRDEVYDLLKFFTGTALYDCRNYAIFSVLLDTGLRISECLSLNRSQLKEIMEGACTIIGKGGKERLALFTWSRDAIKKYVKRRTDEEDALFVTHCNDSRWGTQRLKPDGVRMYLRHYHDYTGIKISPHKLRRTAITTWYQNGMILKDISLVAGHSSVATTERFYLGEDWTKLKEQHKKFSYY